MLDQEKSEAVEKFSLAFAREPDVEKRPGVLTAFRAGWDALAKLLGAEDDRHVAGITDGGFRMMHTLECRVAGMEKCQHAEFIAVFGTAGLPEGNYYVDADGDSFQLTRIPD